MGQIFEVFQLLQVKKIWNVIRCEYVSELTATLRCLPFKIAATPLCRPVNLYGLYHLRRCCPRSPDEGLLNTDDPML